MINNDASTQLVNRFDYAYSDAAHPDQRSSETVTNGASFTFPQNELTTYEHNSLNQLISTTAPEKLFTYDDAGNMTKGYTPDGYQFSATYDAENRLSSIEYTDSGSTVHKAEYIYSGYGFLAQIKKYENGTPVGDIRIMRSGYLAIQERDASNQVVSEYTWGLNMGGGIGGLLNMRQSGNDYQYLYDGRGNVSALLNTSQQVAASYRYDSFGNLMAKTGTLDQPFGFSTKRYDAGTGLSYYGYRFYAPTIGKWLTRDPLGEAGGINLYGFCLNDPVNWFDPLGLEVLSPEMIENFIPENPQYTWPDLSQWTTPDYDSMNAQINWWIDTSGIEDAMNAGPSHPIHWHTDAMWFTFYPFMDTEYDFFEPWGHSFFPNDDQDNICK